MPQASKTFGGRETQGRLGEGCVPRPNWLPGSDPVYIFSSEECPERPAAESWGTATRSVEGRTTRHRDHGTASARASKHPGAQTRSKTVLMGGRGCSWHVIQDNGHERHSSEQHSISTCAHNDLEGAITKRGDVSSAFTDQRGSQTRVNIHGIHHEPGCRRTG
ncbi:hypothetical protein CDEST_08296 [Colletotrichum destructivum]|uniref:Uncharacterized protein n=1 Tax=Colletotrichum destructivum TaxID=34406 RepID=A0AAX4IJ48_9PEZI|nr:hypothetical protein CDEST_08296 [Colletotrichum destructivum]